MLQSLSFELFEESRSESLVDSCSTSDGFVLTLFHKVIFIKFFIKFRMSTNLLIMTYVDFKWQEQKIQKRGSCSSMPPRSRTQPEAIFEEGKRVNFFRFMVC